MNGPNMRPVAVYRGELPQKFGIPRQAGIVPELTGRVVFLPEFRDPEALRGIEGYSHLWLIWQISENLREGWSPTVRPPRLGGNRRMGVFATRSPFRPNPLGLSCVRLLAVEDSATEGRTLRIAGADLMDGTPIYDIKPYIPYADCVADAVADFAPDPGGTLELAFAPGTGERIPPDKLSALEGVLKNDPRPRYQDDPERVYGLVFAGMEVKFTVSGDTLTVIKVSEEV